MNFCLGCFHVTVHEAIGDIDDLHFSARSRRIQRKKSLGSSYSMRNSWPVNLTPPHEYPPEIAGLINGLLTIGFPLFLAGEKTPLGGKNTCRLM